MRFNGAKNTRAASNRFEGNKLYKSKYSLMQKGDRWDDGFNIFPAETDRKKIIT